MVFAKTLIQEFRATGPIAGLETITLTYNSRTSRSPRSDTVPNMEEDQRTITPITINKKWKYHEKKEKCHMSCSGYFPILKLAR
jgi:hypothetical protein